jgi:hypothetical protein
VAAGAFAIALVGLIGLGTTWVHADLQHLLGPALIVVALRSRLVLLVVTATELPGRVLESQPLAG